MNTNIIKIADYTNYEELQSSIKGSVMTALDKNGNKVLLKSFIKSDKNKCSFITDPFEKRLIPKELFFLNHLTDEEYVPKLLNYHDEENFATVVMEFLDDEWLDLYELSESYDLSEDNLKIILRNVILVMYDMCEKGFYHCDIKPENIMVHEVTLEIKIIDFEALCYDKSENPLLTGPEMGTIGYTSPESCLDGTFDLKQSLVFSVGCILYSCIERDMPFKSESDTIECQPLEMFTSSLSIASFIEKCTEWDPWKRIPFSELLIDEWFDLTYEMSSNDQSFFTIP